MISVGAPRAQAGSMPRLSEFFGIVIAMYFDDHAPPHFHALYSGTEARIRIDTLELIDGHLPRRAMALTLEWAAMHRDELSADWERARSHQPLAAIAPLD
jgi:hypothetical protein